MNKTKYIILILALCFSLAFVAYPLRTFGGTSPADFWQSESQTTVGLVIITDVDSPLVYNGPPNSSGDLVFGASTNYTLEDANLGNFGFDEPVVLVVRPPESPANAPTPTSGGSDKKWNCYVCSGSKCVIQTFTKVCQDACKPNTAAADCGGTVTGNGQVPPSQAQYRCRQCRGATCSPRYSNTPCADTCRIDTNCQASSLPVSPPSVSPPPVSPPPVSPPPVSPPPVSHPTESPPLPCSILYFTINGKTNEDQNPLIVWVNALLKGYFLVNNTCKTCTVISSDNWNKIYSISTSNSSITESFKINTAGTYFYKLKCIGDPDNPDDFDEDILSLETVQAVNLPWWREIIPYLGGFLKGL